MAGKGMMCPPACVDHYCAVMHFAVGEGNAWSFTYAISQWKNKDMSQTSWLTGGGNQWIDTNGDDSSIQSGNSDWGAKGPPNGLMDQKKTTGWPAISSSNGMKPGDFSSMNGGNPGGGLVSSDQGLGTSIWGSGAPTGWGGMQSTVGSDKSEAVTSSFNPSLSAADGTTTSSGGSGSPWSQGPKTSLTGQSNTSMSLAPSSTGGMTFTTSSSNNNAQWSGNPHGGPQDGPQTKSDTTTTSTAPSTTSTVTNPANTSGTDNAPAGNTTNAADQGNNNNSMTGTKNGWQGGSSAGDTPWNSQGLQHESGSGWGPVTPANNGPTGWGDASSTSAPGNGSGWGPLPTSGPDSSAPTGWGQSEKVEDHEALGTDIWGAKPSGGGGGSTVPSAWGKPLSGGPGAGPTSQWGTKPPNQQAPAGPGWGPLPTTPVGGGSQTGWGDPSANTAKLPPQSAWGNPGAQGLSGPPKGVIASNSQWGKKPVDQETKWEVPTDQSSSSSVDNGTGVWNSQMQNPPPPPPNAWNKEPPKSSPWGNPGQQPPQQMKPPQPQDSAWGSAPAPKPAWGNPDEPKPPAWRQPPQPHWNQQSSNTDSSRGGAWGAPPPSKPPSSDSNYGSWNKDDSNAKKPSSFSQDSSQGQSAAVPSGSGWMPMLDIPQEIVPTGWGQLSPNDPNKPFGIDDGTYVWGDSKEHNAWVTEMSAKNVLRMKQLKQKAAAAAAASSPGGSSSTSTMQSPTVPTSKPPSTPSSEDGTAPTGFSSTTGGTEPKKQGWDDPGTPTSTASNRPKSESEGGEWQSLPRTPSEEASKWKSDSHAPPTSSSTWNSSSTSNRGGSTQSMDSMQMWNEKPPSSTSIGHWPSDDWDKGSQASDNSGGTTIRRKPSEVPINGNRNPSQIALKLRALTDKGYHREEAEMMLKKHNMDFDRAVEELRSLHGGSDPISTSNDMEQKFSAMALHGNGGGDMSSNLAMMQNMRNKGMPPNLGAIGGPGFPGQGLQQNQRMPPVQKFPQGQMNPGNNQQPMRGGFNAMQQQQQQQLMQVVAGLNLNINSPEQLLHALQQNPQLLAQLQSITNNSGGKPAPYMNRQQDMFRNQFMPQNQQPMGGQSRPRAPFSNNDLGNPNFLAGAGFGQDMNQPQQSRMEQFFKQQRQQQQQNRPLNRHPGSLPKPMRSDENSRSTSPAASESQPNSADSAFSDSSAWPFSQPSIDDQGDGVPEFKPGVPWKPRTSDIANDPDATPGSVGSFSTTLPIGKTPGREREKLSSNHDDIQGLLTRPMRPGNQVWGSHGGNRRSQSTSGGWNYQDGAGYQRQQSFPGIGGSRPNRPGPPPGLENNPRNNNWSRGGSGNWGDSQGTWSGNDGMAGGSNWLMLRNLGNVDSSYLHVMCSQHGMVEQFNLNQSQGMALVAYKSREDAMKARQGLGALGINVSYVNPNEIGSMIGGAGNTGSQWSTGQNKLGWDDGMSSNRWNAGGSGGITGGIGLAGMPGSLWSPTPPGPMGGMDAGIRSGIGSGMGGIGGMSNWSVGDIPGSHNFGSFLPGDLLN